MSLIAFSRPHISTFQTWPFFYQFSFSRRLSSLVAIVVVDRRNVEVVPTAVIFPKRA